jgi:hypothetical protein
MTSRQSGEYTEAATPANWLQREAERFERAVGSGILAAMSKHDGEFRVSKKEQERLNAMAAADEALDDEIYLY